MSTLMRRVLGLAMLFSLCVGGRASSAQLKDEQYDRFYARYVGRYTVNLAKSRYFGERPKEPPSHTYDAIAGRRGIHLPSLRSSISTSAARREWEASCITTNLDRAERLVGGSAFHPIRFDRFDCYISRNRQRIELTVSTLEVQGPPGQDANPNLRREDRCLDVSCSSLGVFCCFHSPFRPSRSVATSPAS
jgi:hypothetical protein